MENQMKEFRPTIPLFVRWLLTEYVILKIPGSQFLLFRGENLSGDFLGGNFSVENSGCFWLANFCPIKKELEIAEQSAKQSFASKNFFLPTQKILTDKKYCVGGKNM